MCLILLSILLNDVYMEPTDLDVEANQDIVSWGNLVDDND